MPGQGRDPQGRRWPQPPGPRVPKGGVATGGAVTSGAGLTWVGISLPQGWRRVSLGGEASGMAGGAHLDESR